MVRNIALSIIVQRFLTWGLAIVVSAAFFGGSVAHAWIPSGQEATIVNVITWQDNYDRGVVYTLSSGDMCYFDPSAAPNGETVLTVVMSAFLAARPVSVHCHNSTENRGGYMAHRHHRIVVH